MRFLFCLFLIFYPSFFLKNLSANCARGAPTHPSTHTHTRSPIAPPRAGSQDCTVRLWDLVKGAPLPPSTKEGGRTLRITGPRNKPLKGFPEVKSGNQSGIAILEIKRGHPYAGEMG